MAIVLSGTTNDITVNGVSVATDAEVSSAVAPKANTADLKEIGVGQTWQDVTASRALGTTYTNSTGKPIMVSARGIYATNSGAVTIYVNGLDIGQSNVGGGSGSRLTIAGIVPDNSKYLVTGVSALEKWTELR